MEHLNETAVGLIAIAFLSGITFQEHNAGPLPPLEEQHATPSALPTLPLFFGFHFKTWKVGQGEWDSSTFITNTKTTSELYVEVECFPIPHAGRHPRWVYWEIPASHNFIYALSPGQMDHVYFASGSAKGDPSDSAAHSYNGRQNTPMSVTIRFYAVYGCYRCGNMGCDRCKLMIQKQLKQDQIDQMRQEYVDAGLSVPSRDEFVAGNSTYYTDSDAGYAYMLDGGMSQFRSDWERECRKVKADATLSVNSGYRNPHHNNNHVSGASDTSRHMFGNALDVQGIDMDGDGEYTKATDGEKMKKAAQDANSTWEKAYEGHVHASF